MSFDWESLGQAALQAGSQAASQYASGNNSGYGQYAQIANNLISNLTAPKIQNQSQANQTPQIVYLQSPQVQSQLAPQNPQLIQAQSGGSQLPNWLLPVGIAAGAVVLVLVLRK